MNAADPSTTPDATLVSRLPETVRAGLTGEQMRAIVEALEHRDAKDGPPVDIRFRLALPPSPYFVTILAGRERRRRRRKSRAPRRLWTAGNVAFVILVVALTHLLGFAALLLYSAILEF